MLGCNKAIILILLKKIVTGKLTFHDRYLPLLRARAAADALVVGADDVIEKEFFVWIEFNSIFLKLKCFKKVYTYQMNIDFRLEKSKHDF